MSEKYRIKLINILKENRPRLSVNNKLEFKNSFGAVAGYLNNNIFIVYGKFGLALKLSEKSVQSLLTEKGFKPFKYFKNGHIKKDYAVIPKNILEDKIEFKKLIDKSIKFAKKIDEL